MTEHPNDQAGDQAADAASRPGRHWLAISQVAEQYGVSRDTVRRRIAAGQFASAFRAEDRPVEPWLVSVGDLLHAGMRAVPSTAPENPPADVLDGGTLDRLLWEHLRHADAVAEEADRHAAALRRIAGGQRDLP